MATGSTITSVGGSGDLSSSRHSKDGTSQQGTNHGSNKRVSFGTTIRKEADPETGLQKIPTDRLNLVHGPPHLGPGCYDNDKFSSFTYNLRQWKCSTRGYTIGARTAPRFRDHKDIVTPSPAVYQRGWASPKPIATCRRPFHTSAERFQQLTQDPMITPGPGIYDHNVRRNRKVEWPQKFGAPIQPIQPCSVRRTCKIELFGDKEFRRYRNRVAYLSMYYD